jgi:hypothetical protein
LAAIKESPGLKIGEFYSLSGFHIVGFKKRVRESYAKFMLYTGQSIEPWGYDVFLSNWNSDNNGDMSSVYRDLLRVKIPKEKFVVENNHVGTNEIIEVTSIFRPHDDHHEGTVRYLKRCEEILEGMEPSFYRENLILEVKDSLYPEWSHTMYSDNLAVTVGKIHPDVFKKAFGLESKL